MTQIVFNISLLISILFSCLYFFMLIQVLFDWKRIPLFKNHVQTPSTNVSIIIAARNEEKNIVKCLDSLMKQNYPKSLIEIIVVDDNSTDSTALLVQVISAKNTTSSIKLLKIAEVNPNLFGKKSAIKIGIENSSGKLIITTDADCIMGDKWVSNIVGFYEQHRPKMIIGPVAIYDDSTGLELLQCIELMSLVAFTGAFCSKNKPIMCNGANLAYERSIFKEVNGFDHIDHIASGDDVLLMNKFVAKFPGSVKFLNSTETIVYTKAQPTFKLFLTQHIRWASKGILNMSASSIAVAFLISSINALLLFNLVLSFFYGKFASIFLMLLALKIIADYALLKTVSVFFNKQIRIKNILVSQLFYSFSVVLILLLGLRKQYEWKGRIVKPV